MLSDRIDALCQMCHHAIYLEHHAHVPRDKMYMYIFSISIIMSISTVIDNRPILFFFFFLIFITEHIQSLTLVFQCYRISIL